MAKVFGIHYIALQTGVKPEEFETFAAQRWSQLPSLPGLTTYLVKGDRGDRLNRYLLIFEFESKETRDRYLPAEGVASAEMQQALAAAAPVLAEWTKYASFGGSPTIWTDYVALASV
jgi:hypothetical protein